MKGTKTVEQIAQQLNLSITTVRLVLSGKAAQYRISVKTQARINEQVERYGYTLNHAARSLKLNKTSTLGLIVPNLSNVFFATLAEKLELRCRRSGYQLTISSSWNDVAYENQLVEALMARNIDGMFIAPATRESQRHHLQLLEKPLVLLDRNFHDTDNVLIESNNAQGSEMLTSHLLDAGNAPVWLLVGDTALPSIRDRLDGYLSALSQRGITHRDWVCEGPDNTPEGASQLMSSLIDHRGIPAAFIASSLPVLEGAVQAIRQRLGSVPPDINIGTFDEHPMLGFLANNIWSMQQDESRWAEQAFSAMESAIAGQPLKERIGIDMQLITRIRAC